MTRFSPKVKANPVSGRVATGYFSVITAFAVTYDDGKGPKTRVVKCPKPTDSVKKILAEDGIKIDDCLVEPIG